jgi:uncharacterized protein
MTLTLELARSWYPEADPVHGFDHIARVYSMAGRIAGEEGADPEIVLAAALLHDARSPSELRVPEPNTRTSHQQASASFARQILEAEGWTGPRIEAVLHCIRAHRFRDRTEPPASLEAKVLFDADKLDAIGAVGVVRAVAYAVQAGSLPFTEPSERFRESGVREPGEPHSAYHEFLFKLIRLKEMLFTPAARKIAEQRHQVMQEFFERLSLENSGVG